MPFAAIGYPSLGIPLISSILKAGGLRSVKVFYFNFDFARNVGIEDYSAFSSGKSLPAHFMEWVFAGELWGKNREADDELFRASREDVPLPAEARLRKWRDEVVPQFLDDCLETLGIPPQANFQSDVNVVGFSCLFQVIPSLALGRRIKDTHPEVKLIYGGSGFHGVPGEELFDKLDWIDAVSTSEAEDVALESFRRLLAGEPLEGLQGMLYREPGGKVYKTPGKTVAPKDFNDVPTPDFDDYVNGLVKNGWLDESRGFYNVLPFESSRGCWWSDRSPCRFCGLNGVSSRYRAKEPDKVISVLKDYRRRYGMRYFAATDNNLSMEYFGTFLPELRQLQKEDGKEDAGESLQPYNLFYNVKSNLSRKQIRELSESGVIMAQPGIESLSDNLLRQMNKGVTVLQNLAFLKNARQYGIFAAWGILMRMYGETQRDYDEMESLVPLISHFNPPVRAQSFIDCHRYSEYHKEKERYFEETAPSRFYSLIYPDCFDMDKIAHSFDVKWRTSGEEVKYKPLTERLQWWLNLWRSKTVPALYLKDKGRGATLFDTRTGKEAIVELDECERAVYDSLDEIADKKSVLKRVTEFCGEHKATEILDSFVEYGFAVRKGEKYLGLAHREGFKIWTPVERKMFIRN
jgi:ribosomal peptide maturation radical SAM protein 1